MTVVETPFFLRKATGVLAEAERAELVAAIGTDPVCGDVIPDTGGVRKMRWALKGRGKRGGARVIYYFHNESIPVFLLSIFSKNEKVNLTQAERNELKSLIPELVRSYRKRRVQ